MIIYVGDLRSEFYAGLLLDALERADREIPSRAGHRHEATLGRMAQLNMAAFLTDDLPSIFPKRPEDVSTGNHIYTRLHIVAIFPPQKVSDAEQLSLAPRK